MGVKGLKNLAIVITFGSNYYLTLIKIHSAYLLTPFIPVVGRVADTNCRVNYFSADKGKQNMPGYMNKHSVPSR